MTLKDECDAAYERGENWMTDFEYDFFVHLDPWKTYDIGEFADNATGMWLQPKIDGIGVTIDHLGVYTKTRLLTNAITSPYTIRGEAYSRTIDRSSVLHNLKKGVLSDVQFVAFDVDIPDTYENRLVYLVENGWRVPPTEKAATREDVLRLVERYRNLDYPMDGVMAADGNGGFFAYKFSIEPVRTVVKGVEKRVGKSGRVTTVIHFEPVKLNGKTVKSSTSCVDYRVGDCVYVTLSGMTVPTIDHERTEECGRC